MQDQVDLLEGSLARDEHAWAERASARERGSTFHRTAEESLRLEKCAQERLHLINRIQSHGHLIAVVDDVITVASEGLRTWLGRSLEQVHGELHRFVSASDGSVPSDRITLFGETYYVVSHASKLVVDAPESAPQPGAVNLPREDAAVRALELVPVEGTAEVNLSAITHAIHELSEISGDAGTVKAAARLIREITGYDRVLAYRFFEDGHGQVTADEHADGMESYLGLHFPASDIPEQARTLFRTKLSRVIYDVNEPAATLYGDDGYALDLSGSELRRASDDHLQFMKNMGQGATFTLSLMHRGQLIGMFTCAHRTPRRISTAARRQLELLVRFVSDHVASERQIARLKRQLETSAKRIQLLAPLYADESLDKVLARARETIRLLIPCDGVLLRYGGASYTLGELPPADAMVNGIERLGIERTLTDSLSRDFPELSKALPGIEGLIVVPLLHDDDYIVFCRADAMREVLWLGDQAETNRETPLSPRNSFALWRESVTGTSIPWGHIAEEAFELGDEICTALQIREQARLAELAFEDPLTKLPNRRFLEDHVSSLLEAREEQVQGVGELALIFIDVNDFKGINDAHGHEVGDEVLLNVAKRLIHIIRDGDVAGRLAGDEFVVICDGADADQARAIAARIDSALSEPVHVDEVTIPLSVSIGVAVARDGDSTEQLLSRADRDMYRDKRKRKRQD